MAELQLDGVILHYEVTGDGPPLLMLAGMMSDSASWLPVLPLLESSATLIRPDNRTTGRTRPETAPFSPAHCAEDALALLDHLGQEQVHVVGHSMGCIIALELAARTPDRISGLTLACNAPVRLARNVALFRTLCDIRDSEDQPGTWLRVLFPWLFAPSVFEDSAAIDTAAQAALDYPFAQSAAAMRAQIEAMASVSVPDLAPEMARRTHTLLAGNDMIIPADIAHDAWAKYPDVRITTIAGAGHSLHWDNPAAFAEAVLHDMQIPEG